MVFVNSSLLMTLGVCSVYDLRYRRIPAIVVAVTTLYIAVTLALWDALRRFELWEQQYYVRSLNCYALQAETKLAQVMRL